MDTETQTTKLERLKQALQELRANRDHFTQEIFQELVMILNDQMRQVQNVATTEFANTDEIRLVTVMFVDVKDSTQLAQSLDTGLFKTILDQSHQRLAAVVEQWDGQIGQYLGDGLLCFFGAQRSSTDDAIRAVSCALAILADINVYAEKLQESHKIDFAVRIGISTGKVVVGMIGGTGKQELLALGPATHLAARLQSLTQPGHVSIDAATFHRVRQHFITQRLEDTRVKGFDKPIEHYTVLEKRTFSVVRFTDEALYGVKMPMVGRDVPYHRILDLQRLALIEQKFQVVTITGDVGIGKSRLLQEILHTPSDYAITPVVMVAHYEKRDVAHHLLRDLLMRQCQITDETPLEEAQSRILKHISHTWLSPEATHAAEIMGYLGGFGFEASPRVQALQNSTTDTIAYAWVLRWLSALADNSLLLIAVDNLQWADADSVRLLEFLAHHLRDTPGILIVAANPIYRLTHPHYMSQHSRHAVVALEQLDSLSTSRLISTILEHVERVPSHLAKLIHDRAEGNPLFVREFLGMLFDNKVFKPKAELTWRFNILEYKENDLPSSLLGVLQARLDDLPLEARYLIQIGAVIGQTFWSGLLAEVSRLQPDEILETLVARGLIVRHAESVFEDEPEFAFRHTLYRDVAYEMMPKSKRQIYHRQVANWLVGRIAGRAEFFAMLAEHFEAGGRYDAALYTYLEAVQNRFQRGILPEALTLIDRALSLARNIPRQEALPVVCQLWTLRGQALNGLSRFEEASAASTSALMLLDELPDGQFPTVRVQAARALGIAYRSLGRYNDAFNALSQAYESVPEGDTPQLAAVLRSFGSLSLYQGRLDESLAYQKRAYHYASTLGEDLQVTASMTQLGLIALERGQLAVALTYFEQVLEINHQRDFKHFQADDLRNIGEVYRAMLNYNRALAVYDAAEMLYQELKMQDSLLKANRGLCLLHLGQSAEGIRLLMEAAQQGHRDLHNEWLLQLGMIQGLQIMGDFVNCRAQAIRFVDQTRQYNPLLAGRALLYLGMANHALGDPYALDTIKQSLAQELEYGGRELWVCYRILGTLSPTVAESRLYYQKAAEHLRAIATSFQSRSDLQQAFLEDEGVQTIFASAQPSTAV